MRSFARGAGSLHPRAGPQEPGSVWSSGHPRCARVGRSCRVLQSRSPERTELTEPPAWHAGSGMLLPIGSSSLGTEVSPVLRYRVHPVNPVESPVWPGPSLSPEVRRAAQAWGPWGLV